MGAIGSLVTLSLAYREPLNRCRCGDAASTSTAADAETPRENRRARGGKFPPRAHCARCRKRTRFGVTLSFIFSPAYVAVVSGTTALVAHEFGRRSLALCRRLARGAAKRARRAPTFD